MQLISNEYRKLNEELHNRNPSYGCSGHLYSDDVLNLSLSLNTQDVLDYGCGKCMLANTLPFILKKYDPAIRAFSEEPEPADLVVCTDVLEHIEPDNLHSVLTHIASKTKKIAYLVIAARPASKTLKDGRNAHLIIENSEWWFNQISKHFDILKLQFNKSEKQIYITASKKENEWSH